MTDVSLALALAALAATAIVALATLHGWEGWLRLKTHEIDRLPHEVEGGAGNVHASSMTRIEIADLKERIRKLEAIAAGVEL